jgi:hypothetical protein
MAMGDRLYTLAGLDGNTAEVLADAKKLLERSAENRIAAEHLREISVIVMRAVVSLDPSEVVVALDVLRVGDAEHRVRKAA